MAEKQLVKKPHFTETEVSAIVEEVGEKKDILFSSLNNLVTNKLKDDTWRGISAKVNALTPGGVTSSRTAAEVRKKWQDLKNRTKAKECERKKKARTTAGGGKPPKDLTEQELQVLNIIGEVAVNGIPQGVDTSSTTPAATDDAPENIGQWSRF